MKLPRFSIAKLMVIVGIVALNIAATQFWSPSSEPSLFTGRFLTSIALQVGLLCLIRSHRTRFLPFWSGFEAFGLAAAITSVYIDFLSPADSQLFNLMDLYLFSTYNIFNNMFVSINYPYFRSSLTNSLLPDNSFMSNFMFEAISFLPQLFIALIGGFLTSLTIRRWGRRHDPVATPINLQTLVRKRLKSMCPHA
jgi:hypothetical protein